MACLGGLCAWAPGAAAPASAQTPLEQRQQAARELEKRLPAPGAAEPGVTDSGAARQERFRALLPESGRLLSQREPFHLLVLGDAAPVWPEAGDTAEKAAAFDEVFARELAALFFYTGGVRRAGEPAGENALGPAISLRHLGRPGGSVLDAPAILASSARQAPVNLVLLCFGQGEAGMSPATVAQGVAAAVSAARELGAEVLLAASWAPMSAAAEHVLGQGRRAADVLAQTAAEQDLPFVNLGSLRGLLTAPARAPGQDVAHWFAEVERVYGGFFHDSGAGHIPRASLHGRLGAALLEHLLAGPPAVPWSLGQASARLDGDGTAFTLVCTVKNTSAEPLDLAVLPLIAGGWRPLEASSPKPVPPGGATRIEARFTRAEPAVVDEPLLRVPLLLGSGGTLEVAAVRAPIEPLAIVWACETFFNQDSAITPACTLVNTGKKPLQGAWQAAFAGAELSGAYEVPPGGSQALELRFEMPAARSGSHPLTLKLSGDHQARATRLIHLTPNLGLGQSLPLAAGTPALQGKATLQAQASPAGLTLVIDLAEGLLTDADAGPAWELALHLDARSYGKRLETGATAALRAAGPAVDGHGTVAAVPAWAFGTGYAAGFDPAEFQAGLLTRAEGARQLRLTLPRSYLYLHEWALENGNSQLGINLRLRLHGPEGGALFQLSPTRKPVDDVSALVVLELAETPTLRATVSVE